MKVTSTHTLTPNTETEIYALRIAESVLEMAQPSPQMSAEAKARVDLETYAELAKTEFGNELRNYTAHLMKVAKMLEQGKSKEQVLAKVQEALGSRE